MSFRKYLYSILCAALIVPFIALGIQQCFNAKDTLENRELVGKLTAELVGREIQSRLEIAKTVVEAAANKLASEPDRNTEALNTYLKELVAHIPYILNIHFDNVSGRSIAFYPPVNKDGESNIGVDHSSREHWKNIISSNSHVISDVVKAVGAADVPIVNITIPARDKRGKLVGYAVCALNLNRLVQNVTSRIAPGEFNIWVFDSRGVPVYTNSIIKELTPYIPAEIVKEVLSKGGDWVTIDRGGPLDLTGYLLPLPNQDWSVGIFRKLPDKETEIGVLVWTNLIFFFVVLLITLIISSLGTQSLINKIKLLMFYAFDYKGSRLNVKTLKSPTEFSQLQKLIVRLNNQKKAVRSDLTDINLAVEREFHKRISGYSETQTPVK